MKVNSKCNLKGRKERKERSNLNEPEKVFRSKDGAIFLSFFEFLLSAQFHHAGTLKLMPCV